MTYKFSVGKIKLKQLGSTIKEIIPVRDIEINYSQTTTKEIGPEGYVVEETKESELLTITVNYASDGYSTSLITGDQYDVVIETGVGGGGVAATINTCKLIGYVVRQAQDEFSITTLTLEHIGRLDASAGEVPTKQTVQFGSVYLGDSASLNTTYEGNVQTIIIPTALGVLIRSTEDMGGGALTILVSGYVQKNTRLELEQYLINLYASLDTDANTLTITYGGTSYTITNCYFVSGRPDNTKGKKANFELEFRKSAY